MAHILIIDDDDSFREILGALLKQHGHRVTFAVNGRAGIRRYLSDLADVILCDILMPDMEGQETIMTLRSLAPHVRIIAMTGDINHGTLYLQTARMLGAKRLLVKPFSPDLLLNAIGSLLAADGNPSASCETAEAAG